MKNIMITIGNLPHEVRTIEFDAENGFGTHREIFDPEDCSIWAETADGELFWLGKSIDWDTDGLSVEEFDIPNYSGTTDTRECYVYQVESGDCVDQAWLQEKAVENHWG